MPWSGLFVPVRRDDCCSLTWWINWLNWWGGVGFFVSGVFLYFYPELDAQTYQIENAFGFGVRSPKSCCIIVSIAILSEYGSRGQLLILLSKYGTAPGTGL